MFRFSSQPRISHERRKSVAAARCPHHFHDVGPFSAVAVLHAEIGDGSICRIRAWAACDRMDNGSYDVRLVVWADFRHLAQGQA